MPKKIEPYFQVSRRKPGSQQKGLKLDIIIILCFITSTTRWRTPRAQSSTTPATLSRQTNRSLKGWFPWIRFGNLCYPHHIKTITTTKAFAKQTFFSTSFQVSTKIAVSSTSIHLVDFDASSVLLTSWNFWTSPDQSILVALSRSSHQHFHYHHYSQFCPSCDAIIVM